MSMQVLSFFGRNFGILKSIPPFPQALDGALLLWTLVTRAEILDWVDYIRGEVSTWPETSVTVHRFGGVEFRRGNREIGHIHGNGVLDVRLSSALREEVLSSGMAFAHHTFPQAVWVSLPLTRERDKENAIKLLKLSYNARTRHQIIDTAM